MLCFSVENLVPYECVGQSDIAGIPFLLPAQCRSPGNNINGLIGGVMMSEILERG